MEERKAFFAGEGNLKGRRLTQAEIGANRDEIRERVSLNPEWLDRKAHEFLTTGQGRVLGVARGNTIYLDPENIRVDICALAKVVQIEPLSQKAQNYICVIGLIVFRIE